MSKQNKEQTLLEKKIHFQITFILLFVYISLNRKLSLLNWLSRKSLCHLKVHLVKIISHATLHSQFGEWNYMQQNLFLNLNWTIFFNCYKKENKNKLKKTRTIQVLYGAAVPKKISALKMPKKVCMYMTHFFLNWNVFLIKWGPIGYLTSFGALNISHVNLTELIDFAIYVLKNKT